MRAISCALISFVFIYQVTHLDKNADKDVKMLGKSFMLLSWSFLALAIVLMALGL